MHRRATIEPQACYSCFVYRLPVSISDSEGRPWLPFVFLLCELMMAAWSPGLARWK
jgi:hypothetical protein